MIDEPVVYHTLDRIFHRKGVCSPLSGQGIPHDGHVRRPLLLHASLREQDNAKRGETEPEKQSTHDVEERDVGKQDIGNNGKNEANNGGGKAS